MFVRSIRDRFARKPPLWMHDAPECRMYVHTDPHERQIDYAICNEVQALDCYRVRALTSAGFAPKIVVDIGAHIGSFTALAAKYFPDARIYSFEPLSVHYDLLVWNSPPRRGRPENL